MGPDLILRAVATALGAALVATFAIAVTPHRALAAMNLDVYYDDFNGGTQSSIASGWWGGVSHPVSQRYGCTTYAWEPRTGAQHGCTSPYLWWHGGIDVEGFLDGAVLNSAVAGTVVQSAPAILAIKTDAGNVVYLLHGTPLVGLNQAVNVGDPVYKVGNLSNGCVVSNGRHLHLEVNVSNYPICSAADDVNPEGVLFRVPAPDGSQLMSLGPASYLSEFAIPSGTTAALYESDRWTPSWSSWTSRWVPLAGGQPQYLLSSQDPVAVRQGPNEWDAFVLTQNGDLGLWYKMPNCSATWLLLAYPTGAMLYGGLAAVSRSSGYLDAFGISSTGHMYHAYARRGSNCTYSINWDFPDPNNQSVPFAPGPPGNFSDVTAASANDNNMYVVAKSGSTVWMTHFDPPGF